jgi:hypothetical protein
MPKRPSRSGKQVSDEHLNREVLDADPPEGVTDWESEGGTPKGDLAARSNPNIGEEDMSDDHAMHRQF